MKTNASYSDIKKLVDSINDPTLSKDDIYTELLNKETNTLNIINRVIETENTKKNKSEMFIHKSIMDILIDFSSTWSNIINEAAIVNPLKEKVPIMVITRILFDNERKIYVGIAMVLFCLIYFFVFISN